MNQARASKINDSGYSAHQRVLGRNPPQMEDGRQQTGELAQERSMTMRRLALQASLALDRKRRWKRALHHAAKQRMQQKKTTSAFWHPGVVISNTLATVWIAYRGSVVKCARSQVRPFNEDDEAAHEHITEHMRDLGERLLHEGDFSYEDIAGHEEPPVDVPTPGEKHSDRTSKNPMEEDKWVWTQNLEDACEEKPD